MIMLLLTLVATVIQHKSAVLSLTNIVVSGRTFRKNWHWNVKNVQMLITQYVKT
ncbi:hypothetical protein EIKCOROL_01274 [Eikenella corrodens ATCC 23834]|uniref:Uncharacterized protein n=2 Tax=Eikenella corrodens TaxID=539 RepID=C0DV85_EIKCO|nr:hypothetical protein EIKCOROL_01274 [Eikenella corrodens ATCC 23834]